MADRIDLKKTLMEVGNKLVTQHGYNPGRSEQAPTTKPIVDFTEFLNKDENARFLLQQAGIDWPVVRR